MSLNRVIALFFSISLFLSCSHSDKFMFTLVHTISKGNVVNLEKLTLFEWDKVHVYGPHSSYEEIDGKLGTSFNNKDYENNVKEGECLFIFMLKGQPVNNSKTTRNRIGCSEILEPGVYAPTDAIFFVKYTRTVPSLYKE